MKKVLSLFMLAGMFAVAACGPSEADKKLADQKRTDSLLEVENKRLQEEARVKDSIANAAIKEAEEKTEEAQEATADAKKAKADAKKAEEKAEAAKTKEETKKEEAKTPAVTKGGKDVNEKGETPTKVTKGGKVVN